MRCHWCDEKDELYIEYHDKEWGVPVYDDKKLFEMLLLENFQAGLSWQCVLHKREAFRKAFDEFAAEKISLYDENKAKELMQNKGIIRNRLKIAAAIKNAEVFLIIQKEFGSFSNYIWGFSDGKSVVIDADKTTSPLSDKISKDLQKRGMRFVGSVTILSYLAAIGVVSAHDDCCFLKQRRA